MMPHEWFAALRRLHESTNGEVRGRRPGEVLVVAPPEERKYWECLRCGSVMSTAAFGKLPERQDIEISSGADWTVDAPSVFTKREITGWETVGEGESRCGVSHDCDESLAAAVMES